MRNCVLYSWIFATLFESLANIVPKIDVQALTLLNYDGTEHRRFVYPK
jgi:hypothetical protein